MIDFDIDVAEIDAEVARMRAKFPKIFNAPKPLNPAALDGQDAPLTPEQSSVTALPFVSQIDEE